MIPSRGLVWSSRALSTSSMCLGNISIRFFSKSHNVQSSAVSRLVKPSGFTSRISTRPTIFRSSPIIQQSAAKRFNSTAPVASASATAAQNLPPTTDAIKSSTVVPPAENVSFDQAADIDIPTFLLDVPEHIGYLKTLGLEYGWGPTAVVEWCLEHIHVLLGTPWWASIILTAVAFRIIMVKPYMDAADNSAKLAHVGPITKPMTIKMRELAAKQDTPGVMAIRSEISMINKRAGIKMYKSFVPLIQMFLGFGTFRLMNGMAHLPVPGLETGGLLWFHNLAIADPYFILPLATSAMMFVVMKKGGETGSSQMSPNTMRLMAYGFPALSFMFTWWLPAAIQLSFFITSVWSAGQVALFNNPSFRNRFGIYPLPEKPNTLDANVVISPYKEHIKVQEMKMKYEPPTAPDAKTTLLGGLKKEISSATEGIKKTASGAAKSLREVAGQERVDGKRTKAELKRAQQYEEMRSKQEKERLLSLDARRREERLRKKAERDAQRKL